jgi:hypothetical protein
MPIKIQDRDISIIQEIAACRFLSLSQIADLCFGGKREAARKRLQKLVRARVLVSKRVGVATSVFLIASRMAGVVASHRGKDRRRIRKPTLSFASIDHELAIRNFRVAVVREAIKESITIEEFSIDSHHLAFRIDGSVVRPDGFFQVRFDDRVRAFFFEVDTGTEPLRTISQRLEGYRSFKRREKRNVVLSTRNSPENRTFQVLFIFKTEGRCKSALKYFEGSGSNRFVLFSTWDAAFTRPFDPLWRFPGRRLRSAAATNSSIVGPREVCLLCRDVHSSLVCLCKPQPPTKTSGLQIR